MALYHKWDVKNGFAYVLQFSSLIPDDLGGVKCEHTKILRFIVFRSPFDVDSVWQNRT